LTPGDVYVKSDLGYAKFDADMINVKQTYAHMHCISLCTI